MTRGADLLERLGFQPALEDSSEARRCSGCGVQLEVGGTATCPQCNQSLAVTRTFRRGKAAPQQAPYAIAQQPQRVAVEWDRGKMTIAASILPAGKPTAMHSELLMTLANVMEAHVGAGVSLDQIGAQWQDLHQRLRKHDRRRRLPRDITLGLLAALALGSVAIALVARHYHGH
jgi:hypothetical protein